jgi:hypothetical protein
MFARRPSLKLRVGLKSMFVRDGWLARHRSRTSMFALWSLRRRMRGGWVNYWRISRVGRPGGEHYLQLLFQE